jgi:NAD(P)-dependent dehydrogenase (short-subunit alcohol dehydrogenase family)
MVTGAASGIGRATSLRLHREGWGIIALDRDAERLAGLAADLPAGQVERCTYDLRDTAGLPALVSTLAGRIGPINALVNNAGVWPPSPILQITDELWQDVLTVNLTAPFVLMREIARVMIDHGGGAIVNVASRNAFRSSTNNAAYDASKAALAAVTRTAAGEFARHRIRVNAVCPGVIDTPGNAGLDDHFVAAYRKIIPMDRFGRPEEIAGVIAFLLSADASFVTGETIVADGGQIACQDNGRFMEIPKLGGRA